MCFTIWQDWLTKYGYLPPPDPSTGQLQAWSAVTQAVKKMQRFAGLDDTGVLGMKSIGFPLLPFPLYIIKFFLFSVTDEETLQLIYTPRCSLPDEDDQTVQLSALHSDTQSQRIKRAVSTWARRNINWRSECILLLIFVFCCLPLASCQLRLQKYIKYIKLVSKYIRAHYMCMSIMAVKKTQSK